MLPSSPTSVAVPIAPDRRSGPRPLVVDVDGTLVRGDLLWEGVLHLCRFRLRRLPGLIAGLFRGRAAFKAFVAVESGLAVESVPLEPAIVDLIVKARGEGRPIVLATGAHGAQAAALGARVGADAVWASDGRVSLTGRAKLERIRAHYPNYDYVGNGSSDLPLWFAARTPFAVNVAPLTLRRARRMRPDLVVLGTRPLWGPLARALRPHQWAKNALLVLPALAAHVPWTGALLLHLLTGFLAFSALASAVYLVNDLADLPHDRAHPTKRRRPLAAGELSIPLAVLAAGALTLVALALAVRLPAPFQAVLAVYLTLTTAYSFSLKRQPLVDVFLLATLYTVRVVAGAALAAVPLSRWFLAFSIFFFLALALAKRAVELRGAGAGGPTQPTGRGYSAADLPVLTSLGTAAAGASSLVYCLYITSGHVELLYDAPDALWVGLPILLYWQARVWLLAGRDSMHEDPVVFALRDRCSHFLLGAFLLILWWAA